MQASESTSEPADPPTMKNAGRLNTGGELEAVLVIVAMLVLLIGGMVQAVMTSQARWAKGLGFSAIYGLVALTVLLFANSGSGYGFEGSMIMFMIAPILGLWLFMALVAFVVGTVLKAPASSAKADVF